MERDFVDEDTTDESFRGLKPSGNYDHWDKWDKSGWVRISRISRIRLGPPHGTYPILMGYPKGYPNLS